MNKANLCMQVGSKHAGKNIRAMMQLNIRIREGSKTVCPSGLRGWTQVPLAQAAWVQIPQLSFLHAGTRKLNMVLVAEFVASPTKAKLCTQQIVRRESFSALGRGGGKAELIRLASPCLLPVNSFVLG